MILFLQRTRAGLLTALLFTVVFSAVLSACTAREDNLRSHVVVKVNDSELTAGEFSDLLASKLRSFDSLMARDAAVVASAKNGIIQDFIVRVVTEQWAKDNQVFVRKETLDAEIQKIRSAYPDDLTFRKALATEGVTYALWVDRLRYALLEKQVAEQLRKTAAAPTVDEQKKYYSDNKEKYQQTAAVRIRQVVLESEHAADRIKKELSAGKSIATLAKKYSITPESSKEGDIGWVQKGALPVFDTAFKLGVGQRSGILKSPFGFHIYEVTAKRPAKALTFDDVKSKIQDQLIADQEQKIYSAWLEKLVLSARVFKDEAFINSIHVQSRGTR